MRLSQRERGAIRRTVAELFGDDATVMLFGSRTDDSRKGGDVDLIVEVPHAVGNRAAAASRLEAALQIKLGDQKIDVLLVDSATPELPVHQSARKHAIPI